MCLYACRCALSYICTRIISKWVHIRYDIIQQHQKYGYTHKYIWMYTQKYIWMLHLGVRVNMYHYTIYSVTSHHTNVYVQPIADRVAQHLEIISKNFQFSTRRTRILMRFIICYFVLIVNPIWDLRYGQIYTQKHDYECGALASSLTRTITVYNVT